MTYEKRNADFLRLAQMMQANPRAYGEHHVRELCAAVISLLDQLKAAKQEKINASRI